MNNKTKAVLALEDGTVYEGWSCGANGETIGEVVFNTSMTGYQEILTDPSYHRQLVTMTYPQIGNYGINESDIESSQIQVAGLIIREACRHPSNFTSAMSIQYYLQHNNIVAIEGIDTRSLTKRIRLKGAMKGVISTQNQRSNDLVEKARCWHGFEKYDAVSQVASMSEFYKKASFDSGKERPLVVAMDFGMKHNILKMLVAEDLDIRIVPPNTTAETILSYKPNGVFLSNGPGDPAAVVYAISTIRMLIGKIPIFGICLGHQLLCRALGGKTYKLKFGHRGANHPVKNIMSGRIEITSQNHGYCVDIDSLTGCGAVMTHVNLNDLTCEGFSSKEMKFMGVQYHPESSPGPHDSRYLFRQFKEMLS
jgi:carbamoyl-phosphate synthase small subunit